MFHAKALSTTKISTTTKYSAVLTVVNVALEEHVDQHLKSDSSEAKSIGQCVALIFYKLLFVYLSICIL